MGTAYSPVDKQDHDLQSPLLQGDDHAEIQSLLEENARLRVLVIRLSDLVLKNIVDRS